MGSLIEELQRREAAARQEADELRSEIARLSERPARAEETLARLGITRGTVTGILGDADAGQAGTRQHAHRAAHGASPWLEFPLGGDLKMEPAVTACLPTGWPRCRTLTIASTVTDIVGQAGRPAVGTVAGPGEDAPRPAECARVSAPTEGDDGDMA